MFLKFLRCKLNRQLIDTDILLLMFDLTDQNSFNEVKTLYKLAQHIIGKNTIKVLVANKSDIQDVRQVSNTEGRLFADQNRMKYYELSARSDRDKLYKMFEDTARGIVKRNGSD